MIIPDTFAEEVYSSSRMGDVKFPPRCLFLPSNEIMTKMILACVGVSDPQKLWFKLGKKN